MKLTDEQKEYIKTIWLEGRHCPMCQTSVKEMNVGSYLRRLPSYHANETNCEPDIVLTISCPVCHHVSLISPPSQWKE